MKLHINRYHFFYLRVFTFWILLGLGSCSDFTEVDIPVSEQDATIVFSSDESALTAVTGIYIGMTNNFGHFANMYTTYYAGMSADELTYIGTDTGRVSLNANELRPNNAQVQNLWRDMYDVIYQTNAVQEGLEDNELVSTAMKEQLLGEISFVRAFTYFYLVNFFGDVPYVDSTDYTENATKPRSPSSEIYSAIITDLEIAVNNLSESYELSNGERTRPNRFVAKALLARVYLYLEDWDQAIAYSTEVINSTATYNLVGVSEVFLANNAEAIWQLYPVLDGFNTMEGYNFSCCVSSNFVLSNRLLDDFEDGDLRYDSWMNFMEIGSEQYWYPYKYKVAFSSSVTEYYNVFRLAEQHLIRAEAYAQSSLINEALLDLNAIRNRAGLTSIDATNKEDILDAILQERRIEFFAEWGHRWLDVKRTGNTSILAYKEGWDSTDALYPIPESELLLNLNLTQNDGY